MIAFREIKYRVKRAGTIINSSLNIGLDIFPAFNRVGNRHAILAPMIFLQVTLILKLVTQATSSGADFFLSVSIPFLRS